MTTHPTIQIIPIWDAKSMSSEIIKDETASNVADDVRSKPISIHCACVYVCVYAYSISFVGRDTCSIWMHVYSEQNVLYPRSEDCWKWSMFGLLAYFVRAWGWNWNLFEITLIFCVCFFLFVFFQIEYD